MKIGYDWPMAEMDSHKWVKAVGRENHGSCMAGTGREFLNNRRGKTKKYRREETPAKKAQHEDESNY